MGIKVLFYILCSMVCAFFTIKMLLLRINEFKKYKISADDGKIKAVVVGHNAAYKGDICPIVSYVVDGNEKQYEYSFYHFEKEFPIGKFPVVCGGHFTIRRVSAVFPTFIFIMVIPQLVFGLQGKEESFLTIVLYIVYLLIYTYLYFMIKKKKEERDKKNGTI